MPDQVECGGREFLRFSRFNRLLHIVMIVSLISLALTGMTLKFSYTGRAATLSHFFGGFESAGYIHRFAAACMIGAFLAHLVDLGRRKRREFGSWRKLLFGPDTMLPTKKDLRDFVGSIRWFLGRTFFTMTKASAKQGGCSLPVSRSYNRSCRRSYGDGHLPSLLFCAELPR